MERTAPLPESELRISFKPLVALLAILGLVFILLSDFQLDATKWLPVDLCALILFITALITWPLESWKPRTGRWLTILALLAVVHLVNLWLNVPGASI